MKLYKLQFVALVILAFFASGYVANLGLLLQKPIWQEPVRTYKYTVEPGHDVEVMVGGAGDTQTITEWFYNHDITVLSNTFTHTWVAPYGVSTIQVELWGGGGAGGGLTTDNIIARGGGGAGGQYVIETALSVSSGTAYTLVIGGGGARSTSNGGTGDDTTFNTNSVVAKGGQGGRSYQDATSPYQPGLGTTTGAIADTVYAGGDGSAGGTGTTGGAGGGGAGTTGDGNDASGNTGGAVKDLYGDDGANGLTSSGNGTDGCVLTYNRFGSGGSSGANTVNTLTTDRYSGYGCSGGARITYTLDVPTFLRESYYFAQAAAIGSTSLATTPPQETTSTDLMLYAVVNKHASTTPTTPAGWTLIAQIEGGDRPSYLSADQGAIQTSVYLKEATSSVTANQSISISAGNSSIGRIISFRKSANTSWEYATSTGADAIVNTSYIATATTPILLQQDDILLAITGLNTDAYTVWGNYTVLNITGATLGTSHHFARVLNTTGLDTSLHLYTANIYSGTTTTLPVYKMDTTGSGTNSPLGSTVFIVIRQTAGGTIPVQVQDVIFFD